MKRQRTALVFQHSMPAVSRSSCNCRVPPLRGIATGETYRCQHVRSCQEFHISHQIHPEHSRSPCCHRALQKPQNLKTCRTPPKHNSGKCWNPAQTKPLRTRLKPSPSKNTSINLQNPTITCQFPNSSRTFNTSRTFWTRIRAGVRPAPTHPQNLWHHWQTSLKRTAVGEKLLQPTVARVQFSIVDAKASHIHECQLLLRRTSLEHSTPHSA